MAATAAAPGPRQRRQVHRREKWIYPKIGATKLAVFVFCHEGGRIYMSDALNWRFSKMTRRAGIGHWHAHEGRHTLLSRS